MTALKHGKPMTQFEATTMASHLLGYSPEVRAIKAKIKIEGKQTEGSAEDTELGEKEMERMKKVWEDLNKD